MQSQEGLTAPQGIERNWIVINKLTVCKLHEGNEEITMATFLQYIKRIHLFTYHFKNSEEIQPIMSSLSQWWIKLI